MKLVEKVLERYRTLPILKATLESCIDSLAKLATHVAIIAHNQRVHHEMISQMWTVHQVMVKKLNDSALDVSLPQTKDKDSEKDKPN